MFAASILGVALLGASQSTAMAEPAATTPAVATSVTAPPPPAPFPGAGSGTGSDSAPLTSESSPSDEFSAAAAACTANTRGDYVHITAGQASGHGWWDNINCNTTLADVTIQLQQYHADGIWRNIGVSNTKRVRSGGGAGHRANARVTCRSTATTGWRSIVDVDLVGLVDDRSVLITSTINRACRG